MNGLNSNFGFNAPEQNWSIALTIDESDKVAGSAAEIAKATGKGMPIATKTAALSLGAILLAALAFFGYKTVSEKKDGKSLKTRVTDGAMQAAQATKRVVKQNPVATKIAIAAAAAGIGFLGYNKFANKSVVSTTPDDVNPDHASKFNTDDSQAYETACTVSSHAAEEEVGMNSFREKVEVLNPSEMYSQINENGSDTSVDSPEGIWDFLNLTSFQNEPTVSKLPLNAAKDWDNRTKSPSKLPHNWTQALKSLPNTPSANEPAAE